MATPIPHNKGDRRFIASAMEAPMLERDYEVALAERWRGAEDAGALSEIVSSHVRLAVRVASRFRGYGLPTSDLIQEGTIGLLEAAKRFDPERGVRFSTYATWWVMAAVQEYIIRNVSIVRLGTTPAQKSLFFNLRRLRAKLKTGTEANMTEEERALIAQELHVPLAAVERMDAHLSRPDRSLNASIAGEDSEEFQSFLPDDSPTPDEIVEARHDRAVRTDWLRDAMSRLSEREREVIENRFLRDERRTLSEIGEDFGVTKERVRQIESKALSKLRRELDETTQAADLRAN